MIPCVTSRIRLCLFAIPVLSLALTACHHDTAPVSDSSTGSTPTTPASYHLTGTVAYGQPVVGKTVVALDSAGKTCATATTAGDGSYSMDTSGCAPGSAALSIQGYTTPSGVPLLSVAVPSQGKSIIDGVVNIDPLTTLLAYDVVGILSSSTLPASSAQVLTLLPQVTAAQVQQATTDILTVSLMTDLQTNYGVPATGLSLTATPFNANGEGLDAFFDAYTLSAPSAGSVQIASTASGTTVAVSLPASAGSPSIVTSSVSYTVGGSVSGLSGGSLSLLLNGANPLVVTADGAFTFPAPVSTTYAVIVGSQPTGQTCTVSNGSGAGVNANVSNIHVVCSVDSYTISGSVSGLAAGAQVILSNNGSDPTSVPSNGTFSFSTHVAYNGSYSVTVRTQPTGQICTASNGSGAGVTADVANVSIVCSPATFSVAGTASGLANGSVVTLQNNGGDPLMVTANGAFTFATPVAYGSSYAVTIGTQPTGQICTASNGSGTGVTADVANVSIVCSTAMFSVGGTVSSLANGTSVTLLNNGSDALTVTANGAFMFATPVAYGSGYAVTIGTQPTGQICTPSSGSGTGVTANVSNVSIVCSTTTFIISGTVSGLANGTSVTLLNSGSSALTVTADGAFTFATPVAYGSSYAVTIGTQPTGQVCTPSNGSGTGVSADVSNVSIVCSTATFSVGGTVSGLANGSSVTLKNNGSDALSITADGAFTFATPLTFGSSYAVTVGTQPGGANCTVANGSGSNMAAAVSNVQITCADRVAFIYVPNYGSNNVLGYKFDFATGSTTGIAGSPFPSGANDRWVTANAAGTFAYVTNESDNTISAYTIDRGTGALTQVVGSPYATDTTPISVTVNPAGTFAYVANANGSSVSAFSIDQTTGALTPVVGSPFAAGAIPTKIAINPAGTFAYVTNQNSATVTGFSIDPATGALTQISGSPFSVGNGNSPYGITVNPAGTVVYVANWQASVSAFSIDPGTGALTEIAGSPFAATVNGWGVQAVAVNPAGTFAYVGGGNGNPLLVFSIDPSTGALTQLTSESYGSVGYNYVVFDSTGSKAIISNAWDLTIAVTNINGASGQLTDQAGSPFGVGARPFDIAVVEP
jgi:6-phosphogluconolactonase (cycloisomerase 2 family)